MTTNRALPLLQRFSRHRGGSAAIEFALLSPIYLLILMGIIGYGIYFGASHSIQQLAADAARASVAGVNEQDRRDIATGFIHANATGYYFVDPARLDVRLEQRTSDQFDVELNYDASALPIWSLYGGLAMPAQTISRRSTIRIGGM